ncbi:MAG: hypothetical protein Tsb0020_55690 [Haliangiales bacterium]
MTTWGQLLAVAIGALTIGALTIGVSVSCGEARPRAPTSPAGSSAEPAPAPENPPTAAPVPAPAPAPSVVVAVADIDGDDGGAIKHQLLARLRRALPSLPQPALAPTDSASVSEAAPRGDERRWVIDDVPELVRLSDNDPDASLLEMIQRGHSQARRLLDAYRADVLIWGQAPAAAPVQLYVTTAESSQVPCAIPSARATHPPPPGAAPCLLDTGASWLLCMTPWAEVIALGCAGAE